MFILLLFTIFTSNVSFSYPSEPIVGGEKAGNRYPAVVELVIGSTPAIMLTKSGSLASIKLPAASCSGTYISENVILTARHCINNEAIKATKNEVFIFPKSTNTLLNVSTALTLKQVVPHVTNIVTLDTLPQYKDINALYKNRVGSTRAEYISTANGVNISKNKKSKIKETSALLDNIYQLVVSKRVDLAMLITDGKEGQKDYMEMDDALPAIHDKATLIGYGEEDPDSQSSSSWDKLMNLLVRHRKCLELTVDSYSREDAFLFLPTISGGASMALQIYLVADLISDEETKESVKKEAFEGGLEALKNTPHADSGDSGRAIISDTTQKIIGVTSAVGIEAGKKFLTIQRAEDHTLIYDFIQDIRSVIESNKLN